MSTATPCTIRPATAADVEPVAALLSAMLEDMQAAGGSVVSSPEVRLTFFRDMARAEIGQPESCWLGAQNPSGALVGVCSGRVVVPAPVFEPVRSLHVSALYVAPHARRSGIGRRLTERMTAWGRERGCIEADLNVLTRNPARGLYEALGFVEVQRKLALRLV